MCRFIETIRLQDGRPCNLDFHQRRMDESIRDFYESKPSIDLKDFLSSCPMPSEGLFKIKLAYDTEVQSVLISPYTTKSVNSFRMVCDDSISYDYKFEDRNKLESLFNKRDNCDDIIIVKNDCITDASFANLAFKRDDQWFTPTTFLLNGTMRRYLLEHKIILEERITMKDLKRYEKVKLINAMLQFDSPEIDVSRIVG